MKLYHPQLDREHEVRSERVARQYQRVGWVIPNPAYQANSIQMSEHDPDSAAAELDTTQPQQEETA
jgi:hypothetical protein